MKNVKKILLICLIATIVCIIIIFTIKKVNEKKWEFSYNSRLKTLANYTKLPSEELIGWIQVQGTNIDLPITKTKFIDNVSDMENLGHAWISQNYSEGDTRKVIYGHNILNVGSEPLITAPAHTRFEQLMSFVYYKFAKDNLYIVYTHDGIDEVYKIFAIGFDYDSTELGYSYPQGQMGPYIERVKENSLYKYNIDVTDEDDIISIITCTRYLGLDDKTQFRVDARKVRENEKISKYSVEKSKKYDTIK